MWRIFRTLIWSVVALVAAWIIASLPGRVSLDAGPYVVETSDSIAVASLLLLFVVLYLLVRLVSGAFRVSRFHSMWRTGRRRRAGDRAVTRALVALAAGDKSDASRESSRARAYLGDTPQTLLLSAEAGRLAGRDDDAAAALNALAARSDAAFLGLRGLLANAIAQERWAEAAALARKAEAAHPGASWLRHERAQLAIRAGDWAEALTLSDPGAPRAALTIGAAMAANNTDVAERLTRQALKADPAFTPAVLAYAGQLRAKGREKRAQAALAEGWKLAPHPDLAAFALAPLTGKAERDKAARVLSAGAPDHPETHLLLARTALDAGLLAEARRHIEAAQKAGINQRRVWLLLAELEEDEHGDTESGRQAQRDALRRAASADPDPGWRCSACRAPQAVWSAACPVCLTPGSLAWVAESGRGAPEKPKEIEIVTQAA
jgi:HemY protein